MPLPSGDDCGGPAGQRHLWVPAVSLAHRSQVHGSTAAAEVAEAAGPLGGSPKRHDDAPQPECHGPFGHVTRRGSALGSVAFGTSVLAGKSPGKEKFMSPSQADSLSPPSQWEPMGSQRRWREPGAERPLGGVFQERDQLKQEQRNPAANGRRLPGREQRDKEMLSPRLTRTWRFVKGIGTAAAQAGGAREEPPGACGDSQF